jgi:peptidoglycan-N-acetylglucosamine deacetylase
LSQLLHRRDPRAVKTPAKSLPAWFIVAATIHLVAIAAFLAGYRFLAVAAVLLAQASLFAGSFWPRSFWMGANLRRLPPDSAANSIALTFDDGPDPKATPQVLSVLAAHGAHASFFCIAERAQQYPEIVRAIVAGGHSVENHSLRHNPRFALLGTKAMTRDIAAAQGILTALAGGAPRYFRPPAGMRNPALDFALRRLDLALVSWTRRGFDTITRDPDRVLHRLTRDLRSGAILVLHDGSSARDADSVPVVLKVLPRLLAHLARERLTAIALPRP